MPLAYPTISVEPSLLSPKIRSTNVMGTSPIVYPLALARTMISIWNTYPFDTTRFIKSSKTGLRYNLMCDRQVSHLTRCRAGPPEGARHIAHLRPQSVLGEKVRAPTDDLALSIPASHTTASYIAATRHNVEILCFLQACISC